MQGQKARERMYKHACNLGLTWDKVQSWFVSVPCASDLVGLRETGDVGEQRLICLGTLSQPLPTLPTSLQRDSSSCEDHAKSKRTADSASNAVQDSTGGAGHAEAAGHAGSGKSVGGLFSSVDALVLASWAVALNKF